MVAEFSPAKLSWLTKLGPIMPVKTTELPFATLTRLKLVNEVEKVVPLKLAIADAPPVVEAVVNVKRSLKPHAPEAIVLLNEATFWVPKLSASVVDEMAAEAAVAASIVATAKTAWVVNLALDFISDAPVYF